MEKALVNRRSPREILQKFQESKGASLLRLGVCGTDVNRIECAALGCARSGGPRVRSRASGLSRSPLHGPPALMKVVAIDGMVFFRLSPGNFSYRWMRHKFQVQGAGGKQCSCGVRVVSLPAP